MKIVDKLFSSSCISKILCQNGIKMSAIRRSDFKVGLVVIFLISFSIDFGLSLKSQSSDSLPFSFYGGRQSSFSSLSKHSLKVLLNQEDSRNFSRTSSSIKVVGGIEATPHQFPFQISLQVRNYYGGYDHNCGGVIYDATHILTVAHCVRGYHPRNLKVVAGEHELFHDVGTEQYRDVLAYVFHPAYNPQTYDNDIAIITLDAPLDLTEAIQPLTLPVNILDYPAIARTSGWGNNGYDNEQQLKLLYVDLDVFTTEECAQAWAGKISDAMICAGDNSGDTGKGSCNGDSGGPLICKDDNDKTYLCGLVSWGSADCTAPNFPTVFTNINHFLDWLIALLPPQDN